MTSRLLQQPCPADIALLVEARLDLDQDHDLLAGGCGADERVHDRALAGSPIQRLLDGEHLRVRCCLFDEALRRSGEGLIGVLDQQIAALQHREHVGKLAIDDRAVRGGGTLEWNVLEVRAIDRVELHEAGEVQGPGQPLDGRGLDLQLAYQEVEDAIGHLLVNLQAYRRAEPSLADRLLEGLEQVLGPVVVHLEVVVAGNAERVVVDDAHAREEPVQVRCDHVLERDEDPVLGSSRTVAAGAGP